MFIQLNGRCLDAAEAESERKRAIPHLALSRGEAQEVHTTSTLVVDPLTWQIESFSMVIGQANDYNRTFECASSHVLFVSPANNVMCSANAEYECSLCAFLSFVLSEALQLYQFIDYFNVFQRVFKRKVENQ